MKHCKNGTRHKRVRMIKSAVLFLWSKLKNLPQICEDFACNADWINRFKLHRNISCGKVSCEVNAVNCKMTAKCLSAVWPRLRERYPDSDVFYVNETGLSFRLTPGRTLTF